MIVAHTADVHLTQPDGERWEALRAVVHESRELGAGALVIAGDLFDKHGDADTLRPALRDLLGDLPGAVIILPGNHDVLGVRAGDFYGERVTVLTDSAPCDVDDVRFIGLPFENLSAAGVLERIAGAAAAVDPARTNMLVYHGELLDLVPARRAFGDEGSGDYMPVRLDAFAGLGFDYVLAGHFHTHFDVRRYDDGYFCYSGSPVSITRRELGPRHMGIIRSGAAPQPVRLDTAHVERVDVSLDPFDAADPVERVRAQLAGAHPRAQVLLRVGGFVDLVARGMNEELLVASITEALPANVVDKQYEFRDVGMVTTDPLFRRFQEKVAASDLPETQREAVRRIAMAALMENAYAD